MTTPLLPELKGVSAELSGDGSIVLPGVKLWLNPATEEDRPYVISTWVRSYRPIQRKVETWRPGTQPQKIREANYFLSYPKIVERLAPSALVLRAEGAGSTCHGYIVGSGPKESVPTIGNPVPSEPAVLHYIYLPPELRGLGLSRAMSRAVCGDGQVHVTNYWPRKWPENWQFNPYRLHE